MNRRAQASFCGRTFVGGLLRADFCGRTFAGKLLRVGFCGHALAGMCFLRRHACAGFSGQVWSGLSGQAGWPGWAGGLLRAGRSILSIVPV